MPTAAAIVFVDYDGTLLSSDDELSDTTRAALIHALAAGVRVVPASSRPLVGLRLPAGPRLDVAIALNGAVARRAADEAPWETEQIATSDVRACVDVARSLDLQVNVYTADVWFTDDPSDGRVLVERRRIGAEPTRLRAGILPSGVHKVLLLGSASGLDTYETELETATARARLHWFRSNPCYLEIVRAGVSKRTGVDVVRGWLDPGRTYAIGNDHSDVAMFGGVDVAIAVGNAAADVKSRADVIVGRNDDDGVACALDSIVRGTL
jgi:Cof subfamily protein (haloacid dehalogenase superfamily)